MKAFSLPLCSALALLLWGMVWLSGDEQVQAATASLEPAYNWNLPAGFPIPAVPADNPMSVAKVDLGRHLFYDQRLSADQSMSCASCHQQDKAFSDGRVQAVGVFGDKHPRNSMALINVAYSTVLNWANPNSHHLETQMLTPLFGETPPEMGLVGRETELLERLKAVPLYRQKFAQAFPNETEQISLYNITRAIASFERSMISARSPYDRYVYAGDDNAVSDAVRRGEALFFSEKLECFHCHGGFNFSDATNHAGSAFIEFNFHNTGLYNLGGKGDYPADNQGLFEITGKPGDMGRFKAPTLRNLGYTAPYMHDGSMATLDEVLDHYAAGGRSLSEGPYAGVGHDSPYKSGFVKGFQLSAQERADLLAFLDSLNDVDFIQDKALSNPFQP